LEGYLLTHRVSIQSLPFAICPETPYPPSELLADSNTPMTLFENVWSLNAKRYFARAEWPSHEMPKFALRLGTVKSAAGLRTRRREENAQY